VLTSSVVLRYVRFDADAFPGAILSYSVLVVGSGVLGYGAFGPVTMLQDRPASL